MEKITARHLTADLYGCKTSPLIDEDSLRKKVSALFEESGRVNDLLPDVADIIDAVVAGGVHFDHVGCRAGVDRPAGLANAAGIAVFFRGKAVDGFGKDLGAGGFAGAAAAAEQIGVRRFAVCDLIAKDGGNGVLSDDRRKIARSPFAVQGGMLGHDVHFLRSAAKSAAAWFVITKKAGQSNIFAG